MRIGDLLYVNRHDRRILLVILTVAAVALGGFFFAGDYDETASPKESGLSGIARTGETAETPGTAETAEISGTAGAGGCRGFSKTTSSTPSSSSSRPIERFPFDPNTADSMQLLRLGLQPWQVHNIYKYRAAGGVYSKKTDFARLYGLTAKQYQELEPYIRISADYQPAARLFATDDKPVMRDTLRFPVKIRDNETIDLNANDTSVYRKVPGIGSYFARRIADYGQRLGGYVSTDQLDEIDGFPQEAKRFFALTGTKVRPLNINSLSLNELRRHPYLNYYQARAIVDYRRQHGPLKSLRELALLPDFSDEAIQRLEPYVCYE